MEWLHIVIIALGIGLMLALNIKWKINAMLALLLGALFIGVLEMAGLQPMRSLPAIQPSRPGVC